MMPLPHEHAGADLVALLGRVHSLNPVLDGTQRDVEDGVDGEAGPGEGR